MNELDEKHQFKRKTVTFNKMPENIQDLVEETQTEYYALKKGCLGKKNLSISDSMNFFPILLQLIITDLLDLMEEEELKSLIFFCIQTQAENWKKEKKI
jgi:hypothetical protein